MVSFLRIAGTFLLLISHANLLFGEADKIIIPKITERIRLDDFLEMKPRLGLEGKLAIVEGFLQASPTDGAPASQKTVVYLAYDEENLYVIFVCFDTQPARVIASMTRRENFSEDEDWVEVYLDTYNDQRRAYCLSTNALGVQWDYRYSEASWRSDFSGHQPSFDALWYSDGRLTENGYLVWMSIPFKS